VVAVTVFVLVNGAVLVMGAVVEKPAGKEMPVTWTLSQSHREAASGKVRIATLR
jgi:hypothetical protein